MIDPGELACVVGRLLMPHRGDWVGRSAVNGLCPSGKIALERSTTGQ